jgi:hypothetical protein
LISCRRLSSGKAIAKDFFGRVISSENKAKQVGTASAAQNAARANSTSDSDATFYFKFQEGFSNAVRRTVYVRDFL